MGEPSKSQRGLPGPARDVPPLGQAVLPLRPDLPGWWHCHRGPRGQQRQSRGRAGRGAVGRAVLAGPGVACRLGRTSSRGPRRAPPRRWSSGVRAWDSPSGPGVTTLPSGSAGAGRGLALAECHLPQASMDVCGPAIPTHTAGKVSVEEPRVETATGLSGPLSSCRVASGKFPHVSEPGKWVCDARSTPTCSGGLVWSISLLMGRRSPGPRK